MNRKHKAIIAGSAGIFVSYLHGWAAVLAGRAHESGTAFFCIVICIVSFVGGGLAAATLAQGKDK